MDAELELKLHRHLNEVASHLEDARDATAALRYALRAAKEFFGADAACLAMLPPGGEHAELAFVLPYGAVWERSVLTGFLRGEKIPIPSGSIVAKLQRRRRRWGLIALRREGDGFGKEDMHALLRIAEKISEQIERIDRDRLLEVRARIDGKVVQQVPPKDLFYQILDGLRSLTGYDHSSSLLIHDVESSRLRVVAEQIAWSKRKSLKIGLNLPMDRELLALISAEAVYGFDRVAGRWQDWPGQNAAPLANLLDYNDGDGEGAGEGSGGGGAGSEGSSPEDGHEPREGTMLCAPLGTRAGPMGLLKVAARHTGSFGPYEADLLRGFVPIASVAIQNAHKTQTLQTRMLEAVKKHAIVDLARGVSHDINNALGAVIPLVQQMQEDVRVGRVGEEAFQIDLRQIEQSLQICRRIFGGMLSFARSSARNDGNADLGRALEGMRGLLGDSMSRRGIRLETEVPEALPEVCGGQGDLEQLLLNLATNARDATPAGGLISIRAGMRGALLELVVADTGCGIPAESMSKIQEPFFTTKPHGTGLGLSTCRWIVWEMRGQMTIESQPGQGTRVTVLLPVAGAVAGRAS